MQNDEQMHNTDEYDYNREPPLDSATTSANRRRSKYVFMTLCFLLALLFLSLYITGSSDNWFPLVGASVLGVLGIIFLRSPDAPTGTRAATEDGTTAHETGGLLQAHAKTLSAFEELVQEALAAIPEEFHEKMANVMVHVADEPDEETLARTGLKEGYILLGLYEGVPLTTYGRDHAPYPEIITIYQRAIEDYCQHDPTRIRAQVRGTVLHEVAHHFGMGHEEMPIWIK